VTESDPETGPQIVPPQAPPQVSASAPSAESSGDVDAIRSAVVEALHTGGHATAAVLLEEGLWTLEPSSVKIAVNSKATMIRLTFNAAAEKLIRQGLAQTGAPTRFLIVPSEGPANPSGSVSKARAPIGSLDAEARNHPLVLEAQKLFAADIIAVVDLRDK
jgi:DNA polymerase-3 subunit gamma/tau